MFADGLTQREVGERREVLVERHRIVRVLVAGDRRDAVPCGVAAHGESVADRRAEVGAGVVAGDLPGPEDRSVVVAGEPLARIGVGVAALIEPRDRQRVVQPQPPAVVPLHFPATAGLPLPVAGPVCVFVLEEAVRAGVEARDGHAESGRQPVVGGGPGPQRVAAAVFDQRPHPFVRERRKRVDVHHAAHRVAPVERRLRAPQHLDAFDVGQFRVEAVLVEQRHVVDVQPDDRLVDARPEPPHVDRRGHARPVVRGVEVRHGERDLLQGRDASARDGPAAEDRRCHGRRPQHRALLDGRHLYAVDRDRRVGTFRVRFVGGNAPPRDRKAQQQQEKDRAEGHRVSGRCWVCFACKDRLLFRMAHHSWW